MKVTKYRQEGTLGRRVNSSYERGFCCRIGRLDSPFQTGADGRQQVSFGDRFRNIIIGTEVYSGAYVELLSFRGQEDKRDSDRLGIRPKSSDDAVSVQARHHNIAKNEIRFLLLRQIDAQ